LLLVFLDLMGSVLPAAGKGDDDMSDASGHEYLRVHQISGDALILDIEQEATSILEAARAADAGHAAKTLVKEGQLRVVILGFTPGSDLHEHRAGGPVSIQVLEGAVEVTAQGRPELVNAGKSLILASDIPHSVTAKDYSVLLLTVAWPAQA
jgi:quercetin dioxygenase-like cupin family protein